MDHGADGAPCKKRDLYIPGLLSALGVGQRNDWVERHLVVVDLLSRRWRRRHPNLPLLRVVRHLVLLSPRRLGLVPVLEVHLRDLQPRVHPDGVDQAVGTSRRLTHE